ncbi:hypothetical protein C2S53_012033 [Perilla frutescens var. hirtella]|uniref:DYW domain-containing protein n=1 Tax=Perilla frutescens var. hirtella TaxID=608512 RepID=A0AAD4PEE5_PERFH|nr:hypothetical protein C2S53_012033 [Perilla frutescens var. hirtella]
MATKGRGRIFRLTRSIAVAACINIVVLSVAVSSIFADEGVVVDEEKTGLFLECLRLAPRRGRYFESLPPSDRWQADLCHDILRWHMFMYEATLKTQGTCSRDSRGVMGALRAVTELPNHPPPLEHLPQNFTISQKTILNLLITKCTNSLENLQQAHALILKTGHIQDHYVAGSLLKCYANPHFGSLSTLLRVLEQVPEPNNGIFWLFLKMNVKPNDITFVAVLNACAHAGFVHQGLKYFMTMKRTYLVKPGVEHYGCVVNLIGKAGYFNEAENLINSLPMKPNSAVWGALLGAWECGVSRESRGDIARFGRSMIDLKGVVHEFKAGDSSHPQIKDIHLKLEEMMQEIEAKGHQPDTSQVLFDISEEERETSLRYHSEKLAIAFGILNMEPGATIGVVKNLRVCEDCHSATKTISRVYAREIIVRDRVRYHHFRNGQCSCKDFW